MGLSYAAGLGRAAGHQRRTAPALAGGSRPAPRTPAGHGRTVDRRGPAAYELAPPLLAPAVVLPVAPARYRGTRQPRPAPAVARALGWLQRCAAGLHLHRCRLDERAAR